MTESVFNEQQNVIFNTLYKQDVSNNVEKKKTGGTYLSYLSWAWAWAEVKKKFPQAKYTIQKFENNLPYVFDPNTGYMVFTTVTIDDMTYEMWLPVMDGLNKAMKHEPYTYDTKNKKGIVVAAATMFDVNKTIMRCLVKNLAMFGLGLYIYAGEDLPESPIVSKEQVSELRMLFKESADILKRSEKTFENQVLAHFKYGGKLEDINENMFELIKDYATDGLEKIKVAQQIKSAESDG